MIQKYEGPIGIEDQPGLVHQARVLVALHNLVALEPDAFFETFADMTSNDGDGVIPGYPDHRQVSIGERVVGSFVPFVANVLGNDAEMYGQLHVADGKNPNERENLRCSLPLSRTPEIRVRYPAYVKVHEVEGTSAVLYVATANQADETRVPQEDLHILDFSESIEQLHRNTPVPEGVAAFDVVAKAFAELDQYVR